MGFWEESSTLSGDGCLSCIDSLFREGYLSYTDSFSFFGLLFEVDSLSRAGILALDGSMGSHDSLSELTHLLKLGYCSFMVH